MITLQRTLEERQYEYAGLRKQYALVESAIRGTAHVAEIQERISKAATEQEYELSVSEDLELVKQLDAIKRDGLNVKGERDLLKRENADLKLDLGKARDALFKAGAEKRKAAGNIAETGQQIPSYG